MSIENYVLQASRRSDCILSVLPCFGGCVINPLRSEPVYSDTPQNNSLSWAEQHGLLTNSNIDISDKGFITHDPTISGGIKTTLDFRGNTTSKTFIAKLLCPQHADGKLHVFPIISQGDLNVTREATFQFNVLENSNGLYNPRFFVSNGSIFSGAALASAIDIEKPHVFAAVWEQSPSASTIRCSVYCDGVLKKRSEFNYYPWNAFDGEKNTHAYIYAETQTQFMPSQHSLFWLLIFDSALTLEELQAFS